MRRSSEAKTYPSTYSMVKKADLPGNGNADGFDEDLVLAQLPAFEGRELPQIHRRARAT